MSFNLVAPPNWKMVKLSSLGEVNRGRSRHRPRDAAHLYGGKYPFIQTGDVKASNGRINKFSQTYSEDGLKQSRLWPAGTMCITIAANIAETGILEFPACFPDSVIGFLPDYDKCDVHFIEYMFRLLKKRIQSQAIGSVQDNINLGTLDRIEFPIPSLENQRRIAKVLTCLDDKIQLNQKINQTLEHIAQAIFKSWFVDFEPVKAKIAALEAGGSDEDASIAAMQAISGKDANRLATMQAEQPEQYAELRVTAELFPSSVQDSEMGEIPEGWSISELKTEIDVLNGFAFKSGDYTDRDGIFVLRTKNFNANGLAQRLDDDVFLPQEFVKSHQKYLCEEFDYHLVMVGASVGKTAMIFPSETPALRNQNMWCFRPKPTSFIGKGFTKYLLDNVVTKLKGVASGSAREFFRKGDFQGYKICFGNREVQKAFEDVVIKLIKQRASLFAENKYLSSVRETLLPKLFSGEISVDNIHPKLTEEQPNAMEAN